MDGRCDMPEQVLFDILLWLPVISLLRFKSVCKSWLALIDSSRFITQHLHHNGGKGNIVASYRRDDLRCHFCLLSGNRYEVYTKLKFEDQWYTTIGDIGEWACLVDSCNGIVCLHNANSLQVALWNPAMKQLRPLPKPMISRGICKAGEREEGMEGRHIVIGFGFDAKANDYKVVRIILQLPPFNQVEVYNLRTASWRTIHKNDTLPFRGIHSLIHATSKSGTCFWEGYDHFGKMLVSFDLKDEVFETMSLPGDQQCGSCYALDFLDDKLAYIMGIGEYEEHPQYFEVWVLHEFGVMESWNKIYKIGATPDLGQGLLLPFGFSKNPEFLLLGTGKYSGYIDQLHLYNVVMQEEKYLPIQEPNPEGLHQFLHYNESLISIKKAEEDDFTNVY